MKLKKYQDRELKIKRRNFMLLLFLCVIGIGLFVYQSFARFQDKATFRIINGKLKLSGGKGDIEFVFYNGDQKVDDLPLNDSGILYISSKCTNGAKVKWDSENWAPTVYNLEKTKTSCELYFGDEEDRACLFYPEGAACKYYKAGETAELLYDDTKDKNLRYVGATPNNYVYFNCEDGVEASDETCETWRIIGVMNNIEDEDGNMGSHLKMIRDKFEKNYSWDSSHSSINNGYGVNEWSQTAIEKVLNNEYLNRTSGSNRCYKNYGDTIEACPNWASIGIRESSRNMISSVKWNTGTMPVAYSTSLITAKYMYEAERSNHHGKEWCQASGESECNDDVARTTTWTGKVGLMYPSDYGYAVGGNVRDTCLGKTMNSYNGYNCMTNDWLYDKNNYQWAMTPVPRSSDADRVFYVVYNGDVSYNHASTAYAVRPVVYLAPSVKIKDGNGEVGDPFVLEYSEN